MRVSKLSHSGLLIESQGTRIVIDPIRPWPVSLVNASATFVSHVHGDHFDLDSLRAIGAKVFAPADAANRAGQTGLDVAILKVGEPVSVGSINLTPFAADHGPAVTMEAGTNLGFAIEDRATGRRILVSGDMAGPQSGLPTGDWDAVFLPVEGGGFVFDPAAAASFLAGIEHRGFVVPTHADDAERAIEEFVSLAARSAVPVPLTPGDPIDLDALLAAEAVAFDFDGVILDSRELAWRATEELAQLLGVVGKADSASSWRRLTAAAEDACTPLGKSSGLVRSLHRELMARRSGGVSYFDEALQLAMLTLPEPTIVTSGSSTAVADLLARDFPRDTVKVLGDSAGQKVEALGHWAAGRRAVYVGDTVMDVEACRRAGVAAIATGWGFDSPADLAKSGPALVVRDCATLARVLRHLGLVSGGEE